MKLQNRLFAVVSTLLLLSCSGTGTPSALPPAKNPKTSLMTSKDLAIWIKAKRELGAIESIVINPLRVTLGTSERFDNISEASIYKNKLAYQAQMVAELGEHFKIADTGGARTVIIQATLTDRVRDPELIKLRRKLGIKPDTSDRIRLILEVRDSISGDLLAAAGSLRRSHVYEANLNETPEATQLNAVYAPIAEGISRQILRRKLPS